MNPHLSIIIPVFNEKDRLASTLQSCKEYLAQQTYSYEIIVVDDGSSDNSGAIVEKEKVSLPALSLITLPFNQGKGAAVGAGMLAAKGELRLFTDADNSTSIEQIEKLLPYLGEGFDIVVGSRQIDGAIQQVKQNLVRNLLGAIYRGLVHTLLPLTVRDTQNGFKLFTASVTNDLFSKLQTKSWSFDVELLVRAQKAGYRIKEVSIVWINDGRSKVRFAQMIRMLFDLIRIRFADLD